MSELLNLAMLVMPDGLFGLVPVFLFIAGGFLILLGFRNRGMALVIAGISLPILSAVIEALMNSVFMAMPENLIGPASFAITVLFGLTIAWAGIKLVFGKRAIRRAKERLLADTFKALLRITFTRNGMLLLGAGFLFAYLSLLP